MDHRVFGGVNLIINFIGLIFRVIILVIYFWSVGGAVGINHLFDIHFFISF